MTGYRVKRDGAQIAGVNGLSYSDQSAVAGTTYSYTVAADDAAGNHSADSAAFKITAPAAGPAPGNPSVTVPAYGVFEQTFTFPSASYSNPWEQVTGSITVKSPSGVQKTVGLFYYGTNTWKARFAPSEVGNWTWTATIGDAATSQPSSGSFAVTASTWPGFVRQNSTNPFRWVTDSGAAFHPIGIGDCIATKLDPMSLDTQDVTPANYFGAFQNAGVNLFRWSVDNCSYNLWSTISDSGNSYLTTEGQSGDQLVQTVRQYGMRTFMAVLGNNVPYSTGATTAQINAVKRYVKYIVDRYGAYVDFWELMNESTVDAGWYDQIAQYLRSVDPYGHPISTSWEQPSQSRIDVVSRTGIRRSRMRNPIYTPRGSFAIGRQPTNR